MKLALGCIQMSTHPENFAREKLLCIELHMFCWSKLLFYTHSPLLASHVRLIFQCPCGRRSLISHGEEGKSYEFNQKLTIFALRAVCTYRLQSQWVFDFNEISIWVFSSSVLARHLTGTKSNRNESWEKSIEKSWVISCFHKNIHARDVRDSVGDFKSICLNFDRS